MIIYIDILIILNLFVDYFLLLSASVLSKTNVKKIRMVFGAFFGSLFSLLIFLPNLSVVLIFLIKLVSGALLVLLTFGYVNRVIFFKTYLIFFAENLILIGVMFFLWMVLSPPGMVWKNGVTYISISPIVLIFGSLIAYVLTCFINFVLSKKVDGGRILLIKVKFNGKLATVKALHDTGNCLIEPFSGRPVCICEYESISEILPKALALFFFDFVKYADYVKNSDFSKYVKLIPCNTVSGNSILPAFLPQSVSIVCDDCEKEYFCYVAVVKNKISDGEYGAIIGDFI